MSVEVNGSCLCNEVKFTIKGPFQLFALCHCSRCRKSTGSAHASNIFTDADRIRWTTGKDKLHRFDLASAKRFSKAFCKECGSPLPCVSRDGKRLLIPAGCLDGDPDIRPQMRIFCADNAPWYEQVETISKFDASSS